MPSLTSLNPFPSLKATIDLNLDDLLGWVVPAPDRCRKLADELLAAHPELTREQLAAKAVSSARTWAAAAGAATGIFASPLSMLPAATADAGSALRIEATLAGTVAALLDPTFDHDPVAFRADVLTVIFPGAVSQVVRELGIKAGQTTTKAVIRRLATREFVETLTRFLSKYLGVKLTEKAVLTKTVPLVGAGIGAAWNWLEVKAVGRRAIRYFAEPNVTVRVVPPEKPTND